MLNLFCACPDSFSSLLVHHVLQSVYSRFRTYLDFLGRVNYPVIIYASSLISEVSMNCDIIPSTSNGPVAFLRCVALKTIVLMSDRTMVSMVLCLRQINERRKEWKERSRKLAPTPNPTPRKKACRPRSRARVTESKNLHEIETTGLTCSAWPKQQTNWVNQYPHPQMSTYYKAHVITCFDYAVYGVCGEIHHTPWPHSCTIYGRAQHVFVFVQVVFTLRSKFRSL